MAKEAKKPKELQEEIPLPSGATLVVEGDTMQLSAGGKNLEAKFNSKVVSVTQKEGKALFECIGKQTRPKLASMRSAKAHLKNMLSGSAKDFSRHLQVLYAHFPVSIEIKGKDIMIKNFLGEKLPRKSEIQGDSKVEVKGQDIFISGSDKYAVGQTANNLMRATKITQKDRRIFQDGIYPVSE